MASSTGSISPEFDVEGSDNLAGLDLADRVGLSRVEPLDLFERLLLGAIEALFHKTVPRARACQQKRLITLVIKKENGF